MGIVRQVVIGLFSVAFLLTGVTMVTPMGSEAEAGDYYEEEAWDDYEPQWVSHKDLRGDHEDLEGKQNMIKETLDAVEGNQAMTHEWLKKIETAIAELEPGGAAAPPCGAGTEGQRFVADDNEVCDNTTGVVLGQDAGFNNAKPRGCARLVCRIGFGEQPNVSAAGDQGVDQLSGYQARRPCAPDGAPV